ncbi:hypothetical protein P22_1988 [Propionispora sp. 2/2-37]|uniref:hypothetical protein n=1 Tax=Propionispora sp. 2/2-37 TaxID=1677858 RepID=UPI0006BB627D|nr:hypothetical protein [Propionispora sp. 2/2-37]CUH95902.1 hypothetical protein P22_1988 [Propionispora sp. 2/2-37]
MTKAQVREFLAKVRYKAVKAVIDKHRAIYENAIEVYLESNPVLKEAIANYEKAGAALDEAEKVIKQFIPRHYLSTGYTREPKKQMFYTDHQIKNIPELQALLGAWNAEVDKVKEEYAKINRVIGKKRDGAAARKFLDSLGFDTSYLDKIENPPADSSEIDTSALFPCKEKGI